MNSRIKYLRLKHIFLGILSFLLLPGIAAAEKLSAELFFQNPSITKVSISPNGKYLALLVGTRNGRVQLATMDLATKIPKVISGFDNADIGEFYWVNNERLVYSTEDKGLAQDDLIYYPGLFAVNKDGSDALTIIDRIWVPESTASSAIKNRILSGWNSFFSVDFSKDSESVFVTEPVFGPGYEFLADNLIRVNTKTRSVERFNRPGDTKDWLIDYEGNPRLNITTEGGIRKVYIKDRKESIWRLIVESPTYGEGSFMPHSFAPDGALYVTHRNKRDKSALFKFNFDKNAPEAQPLVDVDGYDFDGSLLFDRHTKKMLGIRYLNDAFTTVWLDDEMKGIQKTVDALLPATINQITLPRDGMNQFVVVRAYSDVQPSIYLIYDTKASKLDLIGSSFPKIDPTKMAMQDMVRYKARDGLDIPAYLTLPQGEKKKNLPLIVLVHGGPYMRGASWGWDASVQFLASRGYAVLEPEFRGSTGFGSHHFQAGWKQWGLAMQDDIADGTKWAIAQGIADPKRICIAGASYGGYSTLMGLANDPELFKCGVSWLGVTDLRLLFEITGGNDLPSEYRQYGLPVLVGDKKKDAEQLRLTSPVELTDKIKQPLLLAYGGADRRVPIDHGENFYNKIKKTNNQVEWIMYREEGHGWALVKNRLDFWNKVDAFLEKNIGQ